MKLCIVMLQYVVNQFVHFSKLLENCEKYGYLKFHVQKSNIVDTGLSTVLVPGVNTFTRET